MSSDPLTVDLPALRGAAGTLTDTAYRLAHGLAGSPGLVVPAPDWRTGAALVGLESAVHAWFGRLGGQLAGTAEAVRTAAAGYDAADGRAARRLTGSVR